MHDRKARGTVHTASGTHTWREAEAGASGAGAVGAGAASARLVIAAPRSGEGKTSVALGLMSALAARGMRVAAAKVGPDYLDTGFHTLATGRVARNLDVWTMGEDGVSAAAWRAAFDADVVVVEGVMGLFDGDRAGAAACSTADVARLLAAPVVLVVDASRAAASLAALAHGFATFDPSVRLAGVILNRFAEHRDRSAVRAAFARVGLPVLGWIPPSDAAALPSRHLGLVQAAEDTAAALSAISALGDIVSRCCDVDALAEIALSAAPLPSAPATWAAAEASGELAAGEAGDGGVSRIGAMGVAVPRIAVARDDAFAFAYADNIEALEELGAEIAVFSPLDDAALPAAADGIYLPGGYPELFAARLSANVGMLASVAAACTAGVPVYAECGGMLYLLESLTDGLGREHAMARVIVARAEMLQRLQRVGYVEATLAADCVLGAAGVTVRGHEFRYSSCLPESSETPAWIVDGEPRGFIRDNVVASYLHLNFGGCPEVAASFVAACREHAATTRRIA